MDIRTINGEMLAKMLKQAAYNLNGNKDLIDSLNVFPVPDGDTGTNMSLTMNAAMIEIDKADTSSAGSVAKAMSKGSLMGARGNSGVILSQIFRGFAKGCTDKTELTSIDFCHAIKDASDTAYKAVMKPVEGTILTVIRKTGELAMDYTENEMPIHELLPILIKRAQETLDKTPEQLPQLKQAGVVDAGGKGLVFIFQGFLDAILGVESEFKMDFSKVSTHSVQAEISAEDIHFGYCTEFILRTHSADATSLKSAIEQLGDSMVFVQDDDLVKIHVHTNNPGIALESALKHGDLLTIKIENMREQHSSIVDNTQLDSMEHNAVSEDIQKPPVEVSKYGIVSIAIGEGLAQILKDLGVTAIVEGGQTMNPSTEDIIKAIGECHAENIFVLPNNSNIILAANQAKDILTDQNIFVLPTKTVPQGIATLIEFNAEAEAEENYESMKSAIGNVKTLQVTFSVRDTVFNDMPIEKDDILGVADNGIIAVGKSVDRVTTDALEQMIDEDSSILSIYYGEDMSEEDANRLAEELSQKYGDLEVEVHKGGQPLYYYIISVE